MGDEQVRKLSDYRDVAKARGLVPCPRCGAMVSGYATKCPQCSVHLHGEAYDFAPDDLNRSHGIWRRRRAVGVVIVLIFVIVLLISLSGRIC